MSIKELDDWCFDLVHHWRYFTQHCQNFTCSIPVDSPKGELLQPRWKGPTPKFRVLCQKLLGSSWVRGTWWNGQSWWTEILASCKIWQERIWAWVWNRWSQPLPLNIRGCSPLRTHRCALSASCLMLLFLSCLRSVHPPGLRWNRRLDWAPQIVPSCNLFPVYNAFFPKAISVNQKPPFKSYSPRSSFSLSQKLLSLILTSLCDLSSFRGGESLRVPNSYQYHQICGESPRKHQRTKWLGRSGTFIIMWSRWLLPGSFDPRSPRIPPGWRRSGRTEPKGLRRIPRVDCLGCFLGWNYHSNSCFGFSLGCIQRGFRFERVGSSTGWMR